MRHEIGPTNKARPNIPWPNDNYNESMALLRYSKCVDDIMSFDPMDRGTYMKLNLG